jgi:hypothetical protein
MGSLSIWHWVIVFVLVFVLIGGPILGIIRGVPNSSILNAVLSTFLPLYGLIYFFAGKRQGMNIAATRDE